MRQAARKSVTSVLAGAMLMALLMAVFFFGSACQDRPEEKQPLAETEQEKAKKSPSPVKAPEEKTASQAAGKEDKKPGEADRSRPEEPDEGPSAVFMQDLPEIPPKPELQKSSNFSMVYTTDVAGELEDCGCPGHPRGGLARRVEYVQKQKEKGPVLQVDAGNVFFPYRGNNPRIGKRQKRRARVLAKAMSHIGVHAVNVGYQDIQASVEFLKDDLARPEGMDPLPVISANLYDAETGKRLFPPYRVVNVGGVQVGILGLLETGSVRTKSLEVKDHQKAAAALVPYLKERCDLTVVLFAGNFRDLTDLVGKVEGVDIAVVSSRSSKTTKRPFVVKDSLLLKSGKQGMYVGKLDLTVHREAPEKMTEEERARLQEKLDKLRAQQKLLSGPVMSDKNLRRERTRLRKEINKISDKLRSSISKLDYKNHIVSMEMDLPRDEKTKKWMEQAIK
ncbi:MAG: hypothetical protein R6V10_09315 [bacterium]